MRASLLRFSLGLLCLGLMLPGEAMAARKAAPQRPAKTIVKTKVAQTETKAPPAAPQAGEASAPPGGSAADDEGSETLPLVSRLAAILGEAAILEPSARAPAAHTPSAHAGAHGSSTREVHVAAHMAPSPNRTGGGQWWKMEWALHFLCDFHVDEELDGATRACAWMALDEAIGDDGAVQLDRGRTWASR